GGGGGECRAGGGGIGRGLAPRTPHTPFNEATPAALEGLALGLAALPTGVRARTTVLAGPAADFAPAVRNADVVIVDPPRRGLDDVLLDALVRHPPARLIAVSCSLDAFLREARALLGGGRLRLEAVMPFALFPHTAHVGIVAGFARVEG